MRLAALALALVTLPFTALAQSVPFDFQGAWSGTGSQRGGAQWRIDIDLGAETGVAFYPDDQCTARWTFQPEHAAFPFQTASGFETIVTGADQCLDGLGLFLRIGEDGSLLVEWRDDSGIPLAIARLARG